MTTISHRLAGDELQVTVFPTGYPRHYLWLLIKNWFITHKPKSPPVYISVQHDGVTFTIEHDYKPT